MGVGPALDVGGSLTDLFNELRLILAWPVRHHFTGHRTVSGRPRSTGQGNFIFLSYSIASLAVAVFGCAQSNSG